MPAHRARIVLVAFMLLLADRGRTAAAEPVFSGPQVGERATPFTVVDLATDAGGATRDPAAAAGGEPAALIFVHSLERSLVPLLRSVDQYGATNRARLRTEIVFLAADRLAGEQRARAATGSLRLQGRTGFSPDGAEGPGNYGLNPNCLMTILGIRSNRVAANFALVQPGIADAPAVIAALAKLCGDTNPPTAEALLAQATAGRGAMARRPPTDRPGEKPADPFPGAVPTDAKLQGLLRSYIRPTNDDARVDSLLAEIKAYIGEDADLKRQARDGWTRVLHFGDRYGTAHARKVGAEFLESLKTE